MNMSFFKLYCKNKVNWQDGKNLFSNFEIEDSRIVGFLFNKKSKIRKKIRFKFFLFYLNLKKSLRIKFNLQIVTLQEF